MEHKYDKLLKATIWIYVITLIGAFVYNFQIKNMQGVGMSVVAMLTPWIVPIAFKVLKLKATNEVYLLNVVFVYFASLIGSCLGGYTVPFFDKIVHFFSGILMSVVAMMMFSWIKQEEKIKDPKDVCILYLFINAANLAVAALWEFYEYFMLIFFNNDCINHYTTGVHDSITDMLCAFAGGLLITYLVFRYYKMGKKGFFIELHQNFYKHNNKNGENIEKGFN